MKLSTILSFVLVTYGVAASPVARREIEDVQLANAYEAIALNKEFESMTPDAPCKPRDIACIGGQLAQCRYSEIGFDFVLNECPTGLSCYALPLMASQGTAVACISEFSKNKIIDDALQGESHEVQEEKTPIGSQGRPKAQVTVQTWKASFSASRQISFQGRKNMFRKRQSIEEIRRANGELAVSQAKEFKKLKSTDPCTDNSVACIDGKFAQCAGGKWVSTECPPTTQCEVLPLLLKSGTSVTCDTPADAAERIKNALDSAPPAKTPAKGKSKGKSPAKGKSKGKSPAKGKSSAGAPASGSGDIAEIRKLNADDSEAQAKKFSALTEDSPCTPGENACVKGSFAQCVGQADGSGKFALVPCAAPTTCVVEPLVLKRGTTITCDTPEGLAARLEQARTNS